jgi:hypothetical protein
MKEKAQRQRPGSKPLPERTRKEYPAYAGAKIIPFPGVTLETPEDRFQNGLDDFLREMGYIQ